MTTAHSLIVTTPTDREIVIKRTFDAPRALVFRAMTTPELISQWLHGPNGWTMTTCTFDLRVGGKFRYEWAQGTGMRMGMTGTIREIDPPARMVHTEIFDEDWTGGETTVTTTFVEQRGQTVVTITVLYVSREARDGALRTGMTEGMSATYQALDAFLASLSDATPR
ncbi:MAG: SRPBCC family protein [Gemmatimonadaceae bacterium]